MSKRFKESENGGVMSKGVEKYHSQHRGNHNNKHTHNHNHKTENNHNEHTNHNNQNHNQHHDHHQMMVEDFKKRFIVSVIVTVPILILSPLAQSLLGFSFVFKGDVYLLLALASFVFFWGGAPFLKGFKDELIKKRPGMMTLIALAISVAYFYSLAVVFGLKGKFFFWELATLIDVMLVGHWIEMRSVMGASKALEKLVELLPSSAQLIDGKIVDISSLKKGDVVLVKPGEKIPTDGIVVKGVSYIDEAMITGESKMIKKSKDAKIIGGSLNGDGVLEIKVIGVGKDSYLNKVIDLVKQAQKAKSETEKLADVAARWLTVIAIISGLATFFYWLMFGNDLAFAIERLATVMVIACPHALGLAVPLVNMISTSVSAKNGLLIKNRTAFENAKKISTVVFDKTGTLTLGKFKVNLMKVLNGKFDVNDLLQLVASLEVNSEHSVSRGIVLEAKKRNLKLLPVKEFEVLKGEGVRGKVDEREVWALSEKSAQKMFAEIMKENQIDLTGSLGTKVVVIVDGKLMGVIGLSDRIRRESYGAIEKMQKMGLKCFMLTGDNAKIAEEVSKELNLDGFFAEVLPHEKMDKIKELQQQGEFVAMVGDGINDTPALAQANVGIAIGSGTDIAAETADIVLIDSDPRDVVKLISFGRKTYNKMIQNLLWATGYNAVAIPLAAGVLYNQGILISPAFGAALMSLSTVIVAINARLLKL